MTIIYKIKENIFVGKSSHSYGHLEDAPSLSQIDFVFKDTREYLSPTKKHKTVYKTMSEYCDGFTVEQTLEKIIYEVKKYVNGNLVSEWKTK